MLEKGAVLLANDGQIAKALGSKSRPGNLYSIQLSATTTFSLFAFFENSPSKSLE